MNWLEPYADFFVLDIYYMILIRVQMKREILLRRMA